MFEITAGDITLEVDLDLGDGHYLEYTHWSPDRNLNPQYAHLPDKQKISALIYHKITKDGYCPGQVFFDCQQAREVFPNHPRWKVESEDPLTLSPSILCKICGDHGFIKEGKWKRA